MAALAAAAAALVVVAAAAVQGEVAVLLLGAVAVSAFDTVPSALVSLLTRGDSGTEDRSAASEGAVAARERAGWHGK